ncbi:MAG TPA: response regulator [Thermoanaerobaculia bacterium]|nr:response regulator [Thermoanaerobaculia bacterium]
MARILVVEDSPDIRALVRMLLEPAGHHLFFAADGREGVETARREKPDLVLMDLSLPVLSGWEATRQIKSDPETSAITVLAVTAHAMQGDRDRALAAGCDGFLSKPIDEETFEKDVSDWVSRSRAKWTRPPGPAAVTARDDEPPRGRILIVDNEPDVSDLVRINLEEDGHEVVLASSAAEAAERITEESQFDLAVVDVMLGGASGYDLTGDLIARSAEYLPVLLISAGTIDRERGYAAGADDFIAKPLESAELKARCRSLIRIGRAIREQGRAIKERAEAYEKLAALDRLKSDFLSTVSHELRTPLNTIILLSNVIARDGPTPSDEERRRHDLGVIRESAETLLRMINNILDLAKIEAGQRDLHPQRIELAAFLRETGDMLEPVAREKGIELSVEPSSNLPAAAVLDREKLSRVLINLLSNAVKNTAKGKVSLRASPWQDSITFEVEDTGSGIPEHLIATAFEPFRQIRTGSSESGRGTGLGLPISKQLVEVMGGDLLLDSREGKGTRVTFTLPNLVEPAEAAPPPEPAREPEAAAAAQLSGAGRRLLVVEDDAASRYGLKSLLETEGYEVMEAGSIGDANEVLRRRPPDAVILDITLPDGDGAEWVRQQQKKGPLPFPVIALTGVTADEDRRRIEQSGVRTVLQKPVDIPLLLSALEESGP